MLIREFLEDAVVRRFAFRYLMNTLNVQRHGCLLDLGWIYTIPCPANIQITLTKASKPEKSSISVLLLPCMVGFPLGWLELDAELNEAWESGLDGTDDVCQGLGLVVKALEISGPGRPG